MIRRRLYARGAFYVGFGLGLLLAASVLGEPQPAAVVEVRAAGDPGTPHDCRDGASCKH